MSTETVRTVQATCRCGNTFAREVKRGRPQMWCPSCRKAPFQKREAITAPEAHAQTDNELIWYEDSVTGSQRYRIEARIKEFSASLPALRAEWAAQGFTTSQIQDKIADEGRRIYSEEGHPTWAGWKSNVKTI